MGNRSIDRRSFLARSGSRRWRRHHGDAFRGPARRRSTSRSERPGSEPRLRPLQPAIDQTTGLPLLLLPADFKYLSFGWTGDMMSDGIATPSAHDGMAAFDAGHSRVRLIRNHEVGEGPDAFALSLAYDPDAGGGTTTLEFDTLRGELVGSWGSISGTVRNCAGGPTPWASWLTCEETTIGVGTANLTKNHGYILEVPVDGTAVPTAYKAMGRFSHEAVAVDPATGWVYETEDAGGTSGFYRFRPTTPGALGNGGILEMLGVRGTPQFDTRTNQTGDWMDVQWHVIDQPVSNLAGGQPSVFSQGFTKGAARFARLEGAWPGHGRIYFLSTSGGDVSQGQIFEYDPAEERVRLLFESPSADILNAPDNMCVSPRGGLVLCEDGGGTEYVHGLTLDGTIFRFIQNNVDLRQTPVGSFDDDFRGSEFAGSCYSPDGKWLFVNIQSPGISFAITGPWGSGGI